MWPTTTYGDHSKFPRAGDWLQEIDKGIIGVSRPYHVIVYFSPVSLAKPGLAQISNHFDYGRTTRGLIGLISKSFIRLLIRRGFDAVMEEDDIWENRDSPYNK